MRDAWCDNQPTDNHLFTIQKKIEITNKNKLITTLVDILSGIVTLLEYPKITGVVEWLLLDGGIETITVRCYF